MRHWPKCAPPPPICLGGGGRGLSLLPNFQKDGGLDRVSIFREGLLGKREVTFLRKGCSFYLKKKKLKYLAIKKFCKQKCFSLL